MLTATSNSFASFSIAAQSAVETAQICYRQARKDSFKLWAIATHPEAIKTYKTVWNALVIACQVAILLTLLARDGWEWFKRWSDAYVLACQEQPTPSGYLEENAAIPDFEPTVPDVQVEFEPAAETNPYVEMSRRDMLAAAKGRVKGYSRIDTETLRQRLTELHRLG